jgi:hypothetical protein
MHHLGHRTHGRHVPQLVHDNVGDFGRHREATFRPLGPAHGLGVDALPGEHGVDKCGLHLGVFRPATEPAARAVGLDLQIIKPLLQLGHRGVEGFDPLALLDGLGRLALDIGQLLADIGDQVGVRLAGFQLRRQAKGGNAAVHQVMHGHLLFLSEFFGRAAQLFGQQGKG